MPAYLGRFVDSLAGLCTEMVCFQYSPLPHEEYLMDYAVNSPNITLVDIGPHTSVPKTMLRLPGILPLISAWRNRLDVFLLRGPSPLLPFIAREMRDLPVVLLLVGDSVKGVDDLPQPFFRKELIRLFWLWNRHLQTQVARKSLTFVNSHSLFDELHPVIPHLIETHTTTLSNMDFFEREDTCLLPPYHLLYTGRMDRGKGLFIMVEAVAALVQQGEDVILDLVGWPEKGDTILEEIKTLSHKRAISERVVYHGFKTLGPELFAYYKKADIYIIASQSSEGFPRTIWEAMAHSLPVVATKVGSIPDFLDGAAALVAPADVAELVGSISRLLHNSDLRRSLIQRGLALARQNTLESQTASMVEYIRQWLNQ